MEPLYSASDVEAILERFRPVAFDRPAEVADGIQARFVEAGHMLGSASIVLSVEEGGRLRTVVFSGDIGPWGAPLLRDPAPPTEADLVLMESTYGDRDHRSLDDTVREFEEIIGKALPRKGKILVPTFAIGRTQQILYHLAVAFRRQRLPKFPVYLDSPMAVEATKIYVNHQELLDEETKELQRAHSLRDNLDTLKATASPEDSQTLNSVPGPCLIIRTGPSRPIGTLGWHLDHPAGAIFRGGRSGPGRGGSGRPSPTPRLGSTPSYCCATMSGAPRQVPAPTR